MNHPAASAWPEGKRWGDLFAPAPLTALAWSAFQIAIFIWPTIPTLVQRAGHVSFAVALALLLAHGRLKTPAMRAAQASPDVVDFTLDR